MSIPSRHPDGPQPIPALVQAFVSILGIDGPTQAQWCHIGEQLTVGDEPMDRLVEWMCAVGLKQTRPVFEQILVEGLGNVPDAAAEFRDFFEGVEAVPEWADDETLRRGQRALQAGGADGMYVARDVSLLGGYQFSGFNKTLLRTGALEKGSNQRFAETMQWAIDVMMQGGLFPRGIGYQSTLRVRLIHALVRRHVAAMPDWRSDEWGLPINQTDMAATLVGALVVPAVGVIGMGLVLPPAEYEAIAHVTRYVGWLLGLQEQWLPRDFKDSIRILAHTLAALANPDESTRQLATPMVEDPMSWHYAVLAGPRRQLARLQHLSVTSGILGPRAMRALGLPAFVPPWYPMLRIPFNASRSVAALLPGGLDRAAARGLREQTAFLRTMTGGRPTIGASAEPVSQVA